MAATCFAYAFEAGTLGLLGPGVTRHRLESEAPFVVGHIIGPAAIMVVAKERLPADLAVEAQPALTITAVNDTPAGLRPSSAPARLRSAAAVSR